MKLNFQSTKGLSIPLVLLLIVITVTYRIIAAEFEWLSNTAPLMAIAFGGALLMGPRFWWLPVMLLVVSDLALGFLNGTGVGGYTVLSLFFYLGVAGVAGALGRRGRAWPTMWCGTLLAGVLFYVVANTYSWAMWPGYEKSLAGWWQSQTLGVPGINPPAWMFLRNALIADSIWCVLAGILFFTKTKEAEAAAVEA